MSAKLQELRQRMATLKKEMVEESRTAFDDAARDLFAKYPDMDRFSWRQYTPYFNDGDECVFQVHEEADINGKNRYDEDINPKLGPAYKDIADLLNAMDSESMQLVFGDHSEITMSRDGNIKTGDYQHD